MDNDIGKGQSFKIERKYLAMSGLILVQITTYFHEAEIFA